MKTALFAFVAYTSIAILAFALFLTQGIVTWWLIATVPIFGIIIVLFSIIPHYTGRGGLDDELHRQAELLQK
ncbi:hypothetical protein IEU95_15355 [Hoyosella rhizosphaerae]|nr:hypothetical protein [Hoyosella rhizosphaerae]MBN4928214.1 hypothetical protein [Hoyosella rhizosphaerae]